MIYYATVTRTDGVLVYVTASELGGSAELGPFPALGYAYEAGTRVVVSKISAVAEDLLVLGPISTGEPPPTGGTDGDIYGGTPTSEFTDEIDGGTP